jgi:serine/threonine protein kinase/Flp pilus assembly protein TadD
MSQNSESSGQVPPSSPPPGDATQRVPLIGSVGGSASSRGVASAPGVGHSASVGHSDSAGAKRATGTRKPGLKLPEIGEQFFGFRLRGELGRGAYARVFLAEQANLAGRPVVLKVSAIDGDEPQTLAQLQHTHIVPIYSVHEDARAGLRAVCMPYFGGAALSSVLEKAWAGPGRPVTGEQFVRALAASAAQLPTAPIPTVEGVASAAAPTALDEIQGMTYFRAAAWVIERLAQALQHAHRRGVIHRDVKPSNVLVGADGQPMLLDFNVAERADRGQAAKAVIGGTAAYMAPEHLQAMTAPEAARAGIADHRADLYSLGMVLYEMLAGARPFEDTRGPSALRTQLLEMARERSEVLPSLRKKRPDAPWALESIMRQCLAPDPARRYQRAEDLAEDLRRYMHDLPLKYAPELSARERVAKWLRRHPRVTSSGSVGTAAAVLLLCTAGTLVGVRNHLAQAHEQLAVAQAEDSARRFHEGAMRALCLVNTTTDVRDHLRQGTAVCEETLALFDILDNDGWQQGAGWRHLDPDERARLGEDVRELLVLLAGARVRAAPGDEAALRGALRLLDRAQAIEGLPPSHTLWAERAHYLEALGDADGAKVAREAAAQTLPTSARDHYLLAAAHAREGRDVEAIAELDRAIDLNPRHYWARTLRGICQLQRGQATEAVADFGACTGLWPEFAWGYFNQAYARAKAGNKTAAIHDYTTALQRDPDFVLAYLNRGLLYSELGQYEPALTDLRRAAALRRDDAYLHLGIGVALEALCRPAEADAEFETAFARAAGEPKAVRVRAGWVYGFAVAARLPDRAREAFDEVLALDPDEPQALYGRGMLLMRAGEDGAALSCFKRAAELAPQLVEARRYRAILLARAKQFAAAADDVNWCLRERPDDGAGYYAAACVAALAAEAYGAAPAARQATDQALAFLEKALARGYGRDRAAQDPDLKAVCRHPRFAELLR